MKKMCLGVLAVALMVWVFMPKSIAANPGVNPNNNITVQFGNVGIGTYTANPGTFTTIYTAPSSGNGFAKLTGLTATNYDSTAAHAVTCKIVNGSSISGLAVWGNVGIGTTAVNLLATATAPGLPVDQWGNPFHYVPSGYTLQCTYQTALGGGYVAVDAQVGEF